MSKVLDELKEVARVRETAVDFKKRHQGPFERRSGSVFDTHRGVYILACYHTHHGFVLDGDTTAQHITDLLNAERE